MMKLCPCTHCFRGQASSVGGLQALKANTEYGETAIKTPVIYLDVISKKVRNGKVCKKSANHKQETVVF